MGFLTQRLANRFPLWTKVRTDPSSLGHRLFTVYADYFNWAYADNKRLSDDQKLIKRGLGIGYLYQLELLEEDYITNEVNMAGEQIFTYPSSITGDGETVVRVDNIDELAWSPPHRLEQIDWIGVENTIIYTDERDGSVTVQDIDYPSYLLIQITDSLDYYKKTPLRNVRATGRHRVAITGKDINGTTITEHIDILDDGCYWSRNVFTEINTVVPEGFSGTINITIGDPAEFITDPFRICVLDDGNEGPMKMDIAVENTSLGTHTRLRYYTSLDKQGEHYRDGVVEIVPNDEEAWEQYLLSSDGDELEIVDIAIHPNSTRLYALDTEGIVYVYDHLPTSFMPPQDEDTITKVSYLEIVSVKPWARIDEQMRLFTRFVRIRTPILGVVIKRIKPDSTTEYLQPNKTWGASQYEFPGKQSFRGLVEDSWSDFDFEVEFDDFGQWEFYITARTVNDVTTSYTAVMVDGIEALVALDTGLTDVYALLFSPADDLVVVTTSPGPNTEDFSFYVFKELGDYYIADGVNQILYFRENYSQVQLVNLYEEVTRFALRTGIDEIGIHLGHQRIDGESLLNYQRRLILESREPSGPTQIEYVRSLSRQVGEFDIPVFRIDLLLDGEGVTIAEDPFIEITSSRLRAYSNYEDDEIDVEVDFTNRDDGYYLRDIEAAFTGSTFFSIEVLNDVDYELRHSINLRYSNTDVHIPSELLLTTVENRLKNDHLKSFYPNNAAVFVNEVDALLDIEQSGDYFVDYQAGVIYSFDVQSGFCSYTYSDFPFTLYWSPIKSYPYRDDDKRYFHKDSLISDETGLPEFTNLNSTGADIANTVLRVHSLTWGK